MTLLTTFIVDIRNRLDESAARQWTDAQIRAWVNEATKDIARKTEALEDRATIAAVISPVTAEYALAASTIRVHRVEFKATANNLTIPLDYADVKNMDGFGWSQRTLAQNQPYAYTIWGSGATLKLVVHPAPSAAGNFTVWYYRLPVELAEDGSDDSDPVELPAAWDDILLDYVEYRALRKDRDPRWVEAKALYDENLSTMYDNTRRWADEAGAIMPAVSHLPVWLTDAG